MPHLVVGSYLFYRPPRLPFLLPSLFTFKYEVNEQGDFVINDTGKKSCAHSPLPGLIIQTKGVVSRLVSPLSPYLGTTRVARRETREIAMAETLNRPYLLTGVCD